METKIFYAIIVLSEVFSLFLFKKIIQIKMNSFMKFVYLVVIFIPILGPIFYLMISSDLEVQKISYQNRSSPYNNLWGWGRYTDEWADKKKDLQKKIDELNRESIDESNDDDLTKQ